MMAKSGSKELKIPFGWKWQHVWSGEDNSVCVCVRERQCLLTPAIMHQSPGKMGQHIPPYKPSNHSHTVLHFMPLRLTWENSNMNESVKPHYRNDHHCAYAYGSTKS